MSLPEDLSNTVIVSLTYRFPTEHTGCVYTRGARGGGGHSRQRGLGFLMCELSSDEWVSGEISLQGLVR